MENATHGMDTHGASGGFLLVAQCDGSADDCAAALFGHMKSFSEAYPGIAAQILLLAFVLCVAFFFPHLRRMLQTSRVDFFFAYFKRWRSRFALSITLQKFLDAFRAGILHPKYNA